MTPTPIFLNRRKLKRALSNLSEKMWLNWTFRLEMPHEIQILRKKASMILIFHCWWVTLDFALSDCLRIAEVRLGPIIQKEERVIDLLPRLCTIVCANKKENYKLEQERPGVSFFWNLLNPGGWIVLEELSGFGLQQWVVVILSPWAQWKYKSKQKQGNRGEGRRGVLLYLIISSAAACRHF